MLNAIPDPITYTAGGILLVISIGLVIGFIHIAWAFKNYAEGLRYSAKEYRRKNKKIDSENFKNWIESNRTSK